MTRAVGCPCCCCSAAALPHSAAASGACDMRSNQTKWLSPFLEYSRGLLHLNNYWEVMVDCKSRPARREGIAAPCRTVVAAI